MVGLKKKGLIAAVIAVLMLLLTACGGGKGNSITISSKGFSEQDILANMVKLLVENNTDIKVNLKNNLSDNVLFEAFKKGDIDAYVEYTGTALLQYLKKDPLYDDKQVYDEVYKAYKEQYKWTWLEPIGFNDTYALAIRQEDADKYGITTTSQLAEQSDKFVFGSAQEFLNRPDGLPAIKEKYNMKFKDVKAFGAQLDYQALSQKQVDAIIVYTTDGRIPANKIKVLEDDKHLFLPYDAVPIIKDSVLEKHPELKDVLNKLAGKITDDQMQVLNGKVDNEKQKAEDVAKQFLTEQGLLK
ncbi:glycine betaine ABC transporter substrate-binding protein [Cohnella pontilimi]|nr:glycine betaine ABC transporter substrate-binding protein [Cohnella pontilimi]